VHPLLQELAKGGKSAALANTVNELERELVKLKTQLEIKQGTLADETNRIEAASKGVKEVRVCRVF
jgi:structural maintenance of chromosome 2